MELKLKCSQLKLHIFASIECAIVLLFPPSPSLQYSPWLSPFAFVAYVDADLITMFAPLRRYVYLYVTFEFTFTSMLCHCATCL